MAVNNRDTRFANSRNYTHPNMRGRGSGDTRSGSFHTSPVNGALNNYYTPPQPQAYKAWREVSIFIRNLPLEWVDTWELYKKFSKYGQISYIKISDGIYQEHHGHGARIVFSTTPTKPFWRYSDFTLPMGGNRHSNPLKFGGEPGPPSIRIVVSPINTKMSFPGFLTIPASYLFFGIMKTPQKLLGLHMIDGTILTHPLLLELDLTERRQKIDIRFSTHSNGEHDELHRYRLQADLQLIGNVKIYRTPDRVVLVITVRDPPKVYQQSKNLEKTHDSRSNEWKEWPKMWERQTDIDDGTPLPASAAISLAKENPIIDIGRWLTYRLDFPIDPEIDRRINIFCMALDHHNVQVEQVDEINLLDGEEPEAWKYLNPHHSSHPSDLHQMRHDLIHLDFDIRYQLEACISQNRLNEYTLQLNFFQQLAAIKKQTALNLLENVADSAQPYHDPMTIFTIDELRRPRKRSAPHGCVLMHSVTVTPTTLRIMTPTVEVSNRVIRDHSHIRDRFLRVKFEDEDYIGRIFPGPGCDNQEEVYRRIQRTLKKGLDIAGRHYDFLAHGNSQFREHGGYFFAGNSDTNADKIRMSLGKFEKINIVAKYVARLGQCLSTTRTVRRLPRNLTIVKIEDTYGMLNGKKYCFTDGVGKVSIFVAQMIADEFRLHHSDVGYPSVYQFRMAGYKGVLTVDPTLKGLEVALRPSQHKFESDTQGLEIIRVSSFASAYLNQQIILVLTSLGVPSQVFVDKMVCELQRIDLAMTDRETALDLLEKNIDYNQVTLSMTEMVSNGFMETKEPFVTSLLQLWRAWRMKFLKEKAHIPVEQGAFVLGCTDETRTLRMDGEGGIPEIFIQVRDNKTKRYTPREGLCLLARNPSLHPGDIRVVRAIDCDKLLHLRNVVVFPQRGQRDLANMCSGGDLDGDDYLVMWDQDLLPPSSNWNHPAMDFTAPIPRMSVDVVTKDQLVDNFINYIKHDRLGTVATRHRAWADYYHAAGGVKHSNCLKLAQLHSIAVDFPKSGVPAEIDEELNKLPCWPHWMELNWKPKSKIYHSKAVLGQLYDRVMREDFQPRCSNTFDDRILNAYELSPQLLEEARKLKADYDSDIRRIMAQQGVKTEFEIWTAFVMSHNREKRDYVFAEEMGRVVSMLKMHHHDIALEKAGIHKTATRVRDEDFDKLAPFVAAMYTVTKEQVEEAMKASSTPAANDQDSTEPVPLISFPWIFATELGRIAKSGAAGARKAIAPASIHDIPSHDQSARRRSVSDLASVAALEPLSEIQITVRDDAVVSADDPEQDLLVLEETKEYESANSDNAAAANTDEEGILAMGSTIPVATNKGIPAAVEGTANPGSSSVVSYPKFEDWEKLREAFQKRGDGRSGDLWSTDSGSVGEAVSEVPASILVSSQAASATSVSLLDVNDEEDVKKGEAVDELRGENEDVQGAGDGAVEVATGIQAEGGPRDDAGVQGAGDGAEEVRKEKQGDGQPRDGQDLQERSERVGRNQLKTDLDRLEELLGF